MKLNKKKNKPIIQNGSGKQHESKTKHDSVSGILIITCFTRFCDKFITFQLLFTSTERRKMKSDLRQQFKREVRHKETHFLLLLTYN